MEGLLGDLERLANLGELLALGAQTLGLSELSDHLLAGVSSSRHLIGPPLAHCRGRVGLSYGADRSQGVGPRSNADLEEEVVQEDETAPCHG
jgi:hypothetical protein